jgi:hypothetical protein
MEINMKESILGVLRHVLTTAGGYLASSGLIAANDIEVAVGAVIALAGVIWSVLEKKAR